MANRRCLNDVIGGDDNNRSCPAYSPCCSEMFVKDNVPPRNPEDESASSEDPESGISDDPGRNRLLADSITAEVGQAATNKMAAAVTTPSLGHHRPAENASRLSVAEQQPSPPSHNQATPRSSMTSLQRRYHIQKGTGIGKHSNGRGVGRACKLGHLEVMVDSSLSIARTSPRVLRSPCRKKSPIRWFPRRKTESFLERKIRMFQEKEGTVASLDETLGASNLHLSRIEREKLAAQAAAAEAIDARKAALIEASWCRILILARIPCTSSVLELQKAEKTASAALVKAAKLGVILRNGPGSPSVPAELNVASDSEQTVTASLEATFDVDKEVTAAIKAALQHSLHYPVANEFDGGFESDKSTQEGGSPAEIKDGFGTDCHGKHPKTGEPGRDRCLRSEDGANCIADTFFEAESQSDREFEKEICVDDLQQKEGSPIRKQRLLATRPPKHPNSLEKPRISPSLIELMVKRVKDLDADQLTSLSELVATRGLSALLKEQSLEQELNGKMLPAADLDEKLVENVPGAGALENGYTGRPPSPKKKSDLGSILVKHIPKIQREMQAAKESARLAQMEGHVKSVRSQTKQTFEVDSLEKVLVKRVSRLEREKQAAQAAAAAFATVDQQRGSKKSNFVVEEAIPGLAEVLRKPSEHISDGNNPALPEESQRNDVRYPCSAQRKTLGDVTNDNSSEAEAEISEETAAHVTKKTQHQIAGTDLGSILVKHVSRLEREKQAAASAALNQQKGSKKSNSVAVAKNMQNQNSENVADLGSILVKHVSRLEREKQAALSMRGESNSSTMKTQSKQVCDAGLGEILVKRMSRLEKEKLQSSGTEAGRSPCLPTEQLSGKELVSSEHHGSSEECNISEGVKDAVHRGRSEESEEAQIEKLSLELMGLKKPFFSNSDYEIGSPMSLNDCTLATLERDLKGERPTSALQVHKEASPANEPGEGSWQKLKSARAKQMEETWGHESLQNNLESGHSGGLNEAAVGNPSLKMIVKPPLSTSNFERSSHNRKALREKQIQEMWGGLSLGNALKRHVSKLELEQDAWRREEEEARQKANTH